MQATWGELLTCTLDGCVGEAGVVIDDIPSNLQADWVSIMLLSDGMSATPPLLGHWLIEALNETASGRGTVLSSLTARLACAQWDQPSKLLLAKLNGCAGAMPVKVHQAGQACSHPLPPFVRHGCHVKHTLPTCAGTSLLYQACHGATVPSHCFTSSVSLLLLTPRHSVALDLCMAAVQASVPVWGTAMSWSPL